MSGFEFCFQFCEKFKIIISMILKGNFKVLKFETVSFKS